MRQMGISKRFPLYAQALFGMALGVIAGIVFGEKAAEIGIISKFVVELIKLVAMPLLFFAILDAVIRAEFKGKGIFLLAVVSSLNAIGAITIALLLSNFLQVGQYFPVPPLSDHHLSTASVWLADLKQAFSTNQKVSLFSGTTAVIFLSIGLGCLLLVVKKAFRITLSPVSDLTQKALQVLFKAIEWIALLVPIAVFASVAKGVGLYGGQIVQGLAAYFFLCLAGMVLHILLVYQGWIRGLGKITLGKFWSEAREPAVYSFGVNSSLATLPITLKALKNLGVSDSSSRLAACVGTNFNNDGILLYEVVAALFLTQAYGFDLSFIQQLFVAVICIIATIGVAGVPEAGLISLTLVLSALKLPTEVLALLLSVDWVLGRCRSVTNVLGDMTGAIMIDHFQKE